MSKKNKQLNSYVKYSSIAFQMGLTVFVGAFGGVKLDEYLQWGFPIFTITFSILAVALAMYSSIKDFIKMGDKPQSSSKINKSDNN